MDGGITKKPLIVITGPTASGKTSLSIELANHLPIEIISADSRQVFKYLDIGTAKPVEEELSAVPHHFIDILEPDEYFSSGKFGDDAYQKAQDIYLRGKIPVVVGGSGLYVQALCEGFFEDNEGFEQQDIRLYLEKELKNKGIETLYNKLIKIDEASAKKYNDKNPRRIIRALEYFFITKEKYSSAKDREKTERLFEPFYFGYEYERGELYSRINLRTEIMWNKGIAEETEKVINMGFSTDLNSLNTVGYKECIKFLKGDLKKEEAIEEIKKNTRRYAKRQITWTKKYVKLIALNKEVKSIYDDVARIIEA